MQILPREAAIRIHRRRIRKSNLMLFLKETAGDVSFVDFATGDTTHNQVVCHENPGGGSCGIYWEGNGAKGLDIQVRRLNKLGHLEFQGFRDPLS